MYVSPVCLPMRPPTSSTNADIDTINLRCHLLLDPQRDQHTIPHVVGMGSHHHREAGTGVRTIRIMAAPTLIDGMDRDLAVLRMDQMDPTVPLHICLPRTSTLPLNFRRTIILSTLILAHPTFVRIWDPVRVCLHLIYLFLLQC